MKICDDSDITGVSSRIYRVNYAELSREWPRPLHHEGERFPAAGQAWFQNVTFQDITVMIVSASDMNVLKYDHFAEVSGQDFTTNSFQVRVVGRCR